MLFLIAQDNFIEWIQTPPGSLIFILLLALTTALISAYLTRLFIDTDEINRKQVIQKAHDEDKAKITKIFETDPERYKKLRKRWERLDSVLKQSQQKQSLRRMLPSCITFVPMLVIFGIVGGLFRAGNTALPVAMTPMNANDIPLIGGMMTGTTTALKEWTYFFYGRYVIIQPRHGWINFTAYYFLCSFGVNTVVQRLFRLQTQASGGMGQMMGGSKSKQPWPDD